MEDCRNNMQALVSDIIDWKNTPLGLEAQKLEEEIAILEQEISQKRQEQKKISKNHTTAVNQLKEIVKAKAEEIREYSLHIYRSENKMEEFWNKYGKYLSGTRYEFGSAMQTSRLETYFYSVEDCYVVEENDDVFAKITFIEAYGATDCPDEVFWDMTIPINELLEV